MLEKLKEEVYKANLDLVKYGLVVLTWGNASGIDRESGLVVIKPSGVSYDKMKAQDMVVVDYTGKVIEGKLRPSSDTATHLELYLAHPGIGGIVHTHSTFSTAFAQSGRQILPYGTTHADYFHGAIPCLRALKRAEVESEYEKNSGRVINEAFSGKDIMEIPACLLANHGPFAWGETPGKAAENAAVLEEVAQMAYYTEALDKNAQPAQGYLLDKHYFRKHGKDAYYGQTRPGGKE